MKIQWCADFALYDNALGDDLKTFCILLDSIPNSYGYVLDWGGGDGKQCKTILENNRFKCINMDPSIESLKLNVAGIQKIRGIGQFLPFKDHSFAAIHISAALHHAERDLESCLAEIKRVSQPRGVIMIFEPLSGNLIASIARKLFVSDRHDVTERPLNRAKLLKTVTPYFEVKTEKYYFLLSYVLPHLVARLPFKPFWRRLAAFSFSIDKYMLEHFHFLRPFAAYVRILAVTKET